MNNGKESDFRTVRGYQLLNQKEGQLTSAMEDYLEMVYRLCMQNDYVRVGQLAEFLNVKALSASKMIVKLSAMGYLKYDRYEIIQMTDRGMDLGKYLLKRHETIEAFLTLIHSPDPLEETELIEHSLSVTTVINLSALMEFFQTDGDMEKILAKVKNDDL
ncbi:MAG: iron dependent repressor, metal binding and dimerization domain protein [Lacrimispora sp.]